MSPHPSAGLAGLTALSALLVACAGGSTPDDAETDADSDAASDGLTWVRCADEAADTDDPQGWCWDLPPNVTPPAVPDDNPPTFAKARLGHRLFFDGRLSADGSLACAGCHPPETAFADPRPVSVGILGEATPRNAPGLQNAAFYATYTWANPLLLDLEAQHAVPLFGDTPVEMGAGGSEALIEGRLTADPDYPALFAAAFPDDASPVTLPRAIDAIATYVRSLTSAGSPYDRYVYGGEVSALSASAVRGMDLFFSEIAECHHCHGGFHLSRSVRTARSRFIEVAFDNTGLYSLDDQGAYPADNTGLHSVTGEASDMGRFRPPSLRNVALTAPYFHDGSASTLREVLEIYAAGGRTIADGPSAGDGRDNPHKSIFVGGFSATEQDFADLEAFLTSLTDDALLTSDKAKDPFNQH